MVQTATLPLMLKQLRLSSVARHWQGMLASAERNGWDSAQYLVPEREIEFFDTSAIRAASSVAAFLVFAAHYGEWEPHK